jgi:hypothetical protein
VMRGYSFAVTVDSRVAELLGYWARCRIISVPLSR